MWSRKQSEDATVWFTQEGDREAPTYAKRGSHKKLRRSRLFQMNFTQDPTMNSVETWEKHDHVNHSTQFKNKSSSLFVQNLTFEGL